MLQHFGVTPYFVFDGDYLPSKADTEKGRSESRENARRLGSELLALGKTKQAHQALNAAVDVSPEMAAAVIDELRQHKVAYVVAPYEADSQLAYMEREGYVDAVLAEDSDLLVFGVKCLITKLDQYGACVVFERKNFASCRGASLVGWTDKEFRHMAILSGCDYLPNLKSIGLTRAHSLLRRHKTVERVLQHLRFEGKVSVPSDYKAKFNQADLTFLHSWVFCPKAQGLVNLIPLGDDVQLDDIPFIGAWRKPMIATRIARGDAHPNTHQPLVPYPTHRGAKPAYRNAESTPAKPVQTISIASFFKPQQVVKVEQDSSKKRPSISLTPGRIPLAELDPNAFILTTKQNDIQRRPIHTPTHRPSGPTNENEPSIYSNRTFQQSGSRIAKRLCFDEAKSASLDHNLETQSKFFKTPGSKKKARKSSPTFSIHSDGSDAEAFWALTTPEAKKLQDGHTLTMPALPDESTLVDDPDTTLVEQEVHFHHEDTLVEFDDEGIEGATFIEETTTITTGLFAKFACSPTSSGIKSWPTAPPPGRKRKASQSPQVSPQKSRQLGHSEPALPELIPRSPSLPAHVEPNVDDDLIPESIWQLAKELVAVPASDEIVPDSDAVEPALSQEVPSTQPTTSMVAVHGSEDLLVSESEEDGNGEQNSPVVKKLNLSGFIYGATTKA
jgi:exonuclease-1